MGGIGKEAKLEAARKKFSIYFVPQSPPPLFAPPRLVPLFTVSQHFHDLLENKSRFCCCFLLFLFTVCIRDWRKFENLLRVFRELKGSFTTAFNLTGSKQCYSLEVFRFVRVLGTCCKAFMFMHNQMMFTTCTIIRTILTRCTIRFAWNTCLVFVVCNGRKREWFGIKRN